MIEVRCYNCGSEIRSYYATENGFTLFKCARCGLLYVTPRPTSEEISKAHQCGMHEGETSLNVTGSFSAEKVRLYINILKELYHAELTSGKRSWLDIGCGHGEFLMAIKEFGGNVISSRGLEPNVRKQESGRRRGLDISYFDIEDHAQRYDVVSLLNVYSHLPDPPAFLKSCCNLLNPGGELLLETGDAAHLSADEMYRPMGLPDHLSIASQDIVTRILEACGLTVTKVCKYPVVTFSLMTVIKESAKVVWPNKTSGLRYLWNPKYKTDMYIRARKKG